MDALDDPNVYLDITVPLGCNLVWGFQLEPWDATGALAASFIVTPLGGAPQTFAMTVSVSGGGTQDATTQYLVNLTPTQMAALGMAALGNTCTYVVRWTDAAGTIWALGNGMVLNQ